jgi:hypothetical protein
MVSYNTLPLFVENLEKTHQKKFLYILPTNAFWQLGWKAFSTTKWRKIMEKLKEEKIHYGSETKLKKF